ncbi:DUF4349 domain-containing protein [Actinomadura hibisca]|uniref:DUF4349 domain-containing protein n=1 Tax=Actinomadura hibisca TaxID=68565 RepID=UPI000B21F151|nr:DUF4349 domain-containing protein [Actinomadura hibisca]
MSVKTVMCALLALLLAAFVAACSGGSSDHGASSAIRAAPERAAPAARSPGDTADTAKNRAGTRNQPAALARSVVYSAQLRVRSKDVDASASQAKQMALDAGGYVENETSQSNPPSSTVALKIPSAKYAAVLGELSSRLGTKLALQQRAEDVTGEVADVNSRVKSAQDTLASIRKLLNRTGSIEEILKLEEELSNRQADLESLQARQKSLRERTDYATVTVTLVPPPTPPAKPAAKERSGFADGLGSGWNAFTATAAVVATVFGWLLPFLVVIAALGLPVLAVRHRLRDRFRAGQDGPENAPEPVTAGEETGPKAP